MIYIIAAAIGLVISFASLKMREPIVQRAGLLIAFISVVSFGICCFTIVPAGHVGVPVVFGKVNVTANLSEGISIVNPFSNVIVLSIRTENYNMSETPLDVTVVYRLIQEDAGWVHQTFGDDWCDILVRSPSRTSVGEVCAAYGGTRVSEKREEFARDIKEKLVLRISDFIKDRGSKKQAIKIVDVQLRINNE